MSAHEPGGPGDGSVPHRPQTAEPGDTAELAQLSADDEDFVRDLLAGLPAVAVPADLYERLDAAVRGAYASPVAAATVIPLAEHRERRAGRSRLLQVAAAVLVLAAGTVLGVKVLGGSSDRSATSAAAVAAAPSAVLMDSGHAYSDTTLVSDVRALTAGRSLAAGQPATTDKTGGLSSAGTGPSPQSAQQPTAAAGGTGTSQSGSTPQPNVFRGPLVSSSSALVLCLTAIEEGLKSAVQPLAMDQGTYQGQSVLVVVLPGQVNPSATYDVFFVGAGCGVNGDSHFVAYKLVPRS